MVPAEDMADVARYARDRAREGNVSKDRDIAVVADSIIVALAESRLPDEAVLVLGRRCETTIPDETLRTIVDAARSLVAVRRGQDDEGHTDSDEILAAIASVWPDLGIPS